MVANPEVDISSASYGVTAGWCFEHRLADVANGELRDVGAPNATAPHPLPHLVVDRAEILADYVRLMALGFDREYGQLLFERHLHIDAVAWLGAVGYPEQPLQAHHVVDAQYPSDAQVVRERSAELLVTGGPERFGPSGRKAPRLALREETVRRRPDRHRS